MGFILAAGSEACKRGSQWFTPNSVDTTAKVHLDKGDAGFGVTRIELETTGDVPGIDEGTFQKIAEGAKENCPISRLLSPGAEISLTAKLA
jgi:osmotically inducible protein OsmC